MPARPATTEYRTHFGPIADNSPGRLPPFYGTAPHKSNDFSTTIRKTYDGRQPISKNSLMDDWLKRTKNQHSGAFRDSYPQAAPFSSNREVDAKIRLPVLSTGYISYNSSGYDSEHIPTAEETYKRKYEVLLKKLKDKQRVIERSQKLPGGGKGVWRHIKESYGAGNNLMSWVDGNRSLKDSGAVDSSEVTQEKPKEFTGGKGPNRHIIDSYGAGPTVITWLSGMPVRENRFSSCLPVLPTLYQQSVAEGDYPLRGGQYRREEVKGLRDSNYAS